MKKVAESSCQLPCAGWLRLLGELGHSVRNFHRHFWTEKKRKKGELQCLSAPEHRSFCFNLSTFSLYNVLYLSLSPDAACSPFSTFLVLPRLLCFLYQVLFICRSSYCLAEHQSLLCSFMLSLLSQSQFSLSTPPACCFPHGLASFQTCVPPILPS